MTRAVLLARVSRGERAQDPESQLLALRAVAQRLGWEVAEEIPLKMSAWNDEAAAKVRRRALAPIEDGRADLLAVWSLDRVCREGVEGAFRFLRLLEQHHGARFYSVQEPFLSTGGDPQQRELMVSLLAWVARWDSERKSERLRAKAASKRARAEAGGGRARWGRGQMPTETDLARMRALRAKGATIREVAAEIGLSVGTVSNYLSDQARE